MMVVKSKNKINTFDTTDNNLICFLEKNEILPIKNYNGLASYIKSKKLLKYCNEYEKGGANG